MVVVEKAQDGGYCVACGKDSFLNKSETFYRIKVGVTSLSRVCLCTACMVELRTSIDPFLLGEKKNG